MTKKKRNEALGGHFHRLSKALQMSSLVFLQIYYLFWILIEIKVDKQACFTLNAKSPNSSFKWVKLKWKNNMLEEMMNCEI